MPDSMMPNIETLNRQPQEAGRAGGMKNISQFRQSGDWPPAHGDGGAPGEMPEGGGIAADMNPNLFGVSSRKFAAPVADLKVFRSLTESKSGPVSFAKPLKRGVFSKREKENLVAQGATGKVAGDSQGAAKWLPSPSQMDGTDVDNLVEVTVRDGRYPEPESEEKPGISLNRGSKEKASTGKGA